jgi:anti-sigma regulatory factor (Ser/Thr protein kinase)
MPPSRVAVGPEASNVVPLRYVARAGLLPELTRQTYDSLYKALREVILNSVDAGATSVVVDLSRVESDGTLEISDDGAGMSLDELQQSFMSLGGSQKFGSADKFGRIGVGSLALMHYAQRVEIETTTAGSTAVTKAVIAHPWALDQTQRAQDLGDFRAGDAWEEHTAAASAHHTVVRLHGVDEVLLGECADVGAYFKLVDRLRRILPLGWDGETDLARQLAETSPELVETLRAYTDDFRAQVIVRSRWSVDDALTKRIYGDGVAQDERWNGTPRPILKDVVVDDGGEDRTVRVVGYLLSQVRPSVEWSGLTARVQNVAVEERTFFDLESDPGFRKYISGEVWLLGDIDRARLINIDRTSFNRESPDYRAVSRVMQSELVRFKAECVQAPQRAKVAIKRRLDQQVALLHAAEKLANALSLTLEEVGSDQTRLPSSNNGPLRVKRPRGLIDDLQELGAVVAVEKLDRTRKQPYVLRVAEDGRRVLVQVTDELVHPKVGVAGASYALRIVEARAFDPPVIVRNRPREIVFNLAHDVFRGQVRQAAIEMVMALEFAYLIATSRSDEDLYDRVLSLLASC